MKRDILDWTFREVMGLCNRGKECLKCPAYREDYEKVGDSPCLFGCLTDVAPFGWREDTLPRLYTRAEVEGARGIKMLYPDKTTIVKREWGIELREKTQTRVVNIENKDLFSELEVGECLEIADVLGEE